MALPTCSRSVHAAARSTAARSWPGPARLSLLLAGLTLLAPQDGCVNAYCPALLHNPIAPPYCPALLHPPISSPYCPALLPLARQEGSLDDLDDALLEAVADGDGEATASLLSAG